MNWHSRTVDETSIMFQTDVKNGLDSDEAKKRLEEYGENTIESGIKKRGIVRRFFEQLNDIMVIILISSAAASFIVSWLKGENGFTDSLIIIMIVILNAVLGVVQESKAEKAIEELKKMTVPHARVLRDGHIVQIESDYVVPGDILVLETGDKIAADARLISTGSIKTDESALTGESVPVSKDAKLKFNEKTQPADRKNMVFSSTYITYGKGRAIVTATGMETEVGKIAAMIADDSIAETPLQKRLDSTGKILGVSAIAICGLIFFIGLLRKYSAFDMFMTSVSLAVAAIPEGLPAIVTIVLAIGMQRMSKKNTIVRTLPAVETLGSAQVICTDKTGTLTKNRMSVVKITDGSENTSMNSKRFILRMAVLCTDCFYEDRHFSGEPTEVAIAEAAESMGENKLKLESVMPRISDIPFSSERKMMTTVHKFEDNTNLCITKGAPERVLKLCTTFADGKKITLADLTKLNSINESMTSSALRVLAVAYKEANKINNKYEGDMIFAGFIGMLDPPRDEAEQAVGECKKAGIKVVMITGDHALTAKAIAEKTGIYSDGDLIVDGEQLEEMSKDELNEKLDKISVFARVSPEHKLKIVNAYKQKGKIVAMTGDGVNDAPALKTADIGCAMGKNGTDVAKGASDMIITDDNFSTIVSAVREGRIIYNNIRKAVHFLLSSNIGEILTIFTAMLFGWSTPLLPIHLLWVNLITDSLPAIALGLDRPEEDVMENQPIAPDRSLFSGGLGYRIAYEGFMIGALALIAFGIGHKYYDANELHNISRTMAFAVLSISQLIHAFNMRTEKSIFSVHILSNKYLCLALMIGVAMQASVIMIAPLSKIFMVTPLNLRQWLEVAILSFIPILFVEFEKAVLKK
ncbi:MAG: calcium-translocating P-type ATPase, PMCA-type [Candidatus Metalachnospira sp.]|nr:calcium-translocating P-type ATPase, PMCA-type [Candidatus Metalachnospira sp.]